ncbi:hypothetical protein OG339_48165 (plasmid) [Streptosporangium sp. NBC_01495]|uniref:hypothetical protein n=1 Tax=Streptosporangium sp. NBC_01495 TaxID=2903899 RepID=UPI002E3156AE|nr:hypothetical protein [Streptosporangium sp. NBC_01495]
MTPASTAAVLMRADLRATIRVTIATELGEADPRVHLQRVLAAHGQLPPSSRPLALGRCSAPKGLHRYLMGEVS